MPLDNGMITPMTDQTRSTENNITKNKSHPPIPFNLLATLFLAILTITNCCLKTFLGVI